MMLQAKVRNGCSYCYLLGVSEVAASGTGPGRSVASPSRKLPSTPTCRSCCFADSMHR